MKLGAWVVMLSGLILFLTFMGISTGLDDILVSIGIMDTVGGTANAANLGGSSLFGQLFTGTGFLVTLGLTSIISIGLYLTSKDINVLFAPFVIFIAQLFIKTFYSVTKLVGGTGYEWATNITILIFSLLGIGFIFACVDYVRNS
jgi:uncharacterized membrane protein YqhA